MIKNIINKLIDTIFNKDQMWDDYHERFMMPRIKQAEKNGVPYYLIEFLVDSAYQHAEPPYTFPALLFRDSIETYYAMRGNWSDRRRKSELSLYTPVTGKYLGNFTPQN